MGYSKTKTTSELNQQKIADFAVSSSSEGRILDGTVGKDGCVDGQE